MPLRDTPRAVWDPPGEAAPARRNAHVKVIGSLVLLAFVAVAVAVLV